MLANNHFGTPVEENEDNTFITIPIDLIKDVNGQPNLSDLQDFFIGQLPDGTYCLFNNNTIEPSSLTGQDESILQNASDQLPHLQYNLLSLDEAMDSNLQKNVTSGNQIGSKFLLSNEKSEKHNFPNTPQSSPLKNIQPKPTMEKFKCVKCEKLFNKLSELHTHLKWHKSQKKFKCSHCNEGYTVERNLQLHTAMVHSDGNLTKCPICHVNFTSQRSASLKSHLMLHHIEELYTCDKCNSEFDHEDDCIKHMLIHSQEDHSPKAKQNNYLSCYHCKLQFQNSKELRHHVSSHVKIKRFFHRQKRFNKSREILVKEKKFSCNVCSKAFIKKSLLDRHRRIHSGEKPFKCIICDRSFSQKSTLSVHLLKHTGIRPFACTLCPAKFGQKGNLRVHIQKTHTVQTGQTDQLFRCTHCTCVFKKVSSLNAHVTRVHVNESVIPDFDNVLRDLLELQKLTTKNIENNEFDKNIVKDAVKERDDIQEVKPDLKSNVVEDKGVRSMVTLSEVSNDGSLRKYLVKLKKKGENRWYLCNYCSKEFKKPSDLIRHIRVHTKEKPFKCHYCKANFSIKSTLITHMNTHRTDRQFKCVLCYRTFDTLNYLNTHIWKHDIIIPPKFQCITCGFLCETEEVGNKHRTHMGDVHGEHIIEPFDKILTKFGETNTEKDKEIKPGSETNKLYNCLICTQRFYKKVHLLRHLSFHNGERKHLCQLCQSSFFTHQKLRLHLDTYHNEKQFKCTQCNRKFSNDNQLKEHDKEHSNNICQCCGEDCKCSLLEQNNKKEQTTQVTDQQPGRIINTQNILEYRVPENVGILNTDLIGKERVSDNVYVPYVLTPLNDLEVLNLGENIDSDLQRIYVSVDPAQLENHSLNVANPGQENLKASNNSIGEIKLTTAGDIVRTTSVISKAPNKNKPNILRNYPGKKWKSLFHDYTRDLKENPNPVENNTFVSQATVDNIDNQEAVIDFNDPKCFLQNANIICINCSRLHSDFKAFQNHTCNVDFNQVEQNEQENAIDQVSGPSDDTSQKESQGSATAPRSEVCQPKDIESTNKNISADSKKRKKLTKPIECHLCKRSFTDRAEYKNHLKFHSKARRYECSICKKLIVGRITYMKHLNDAHSDENGSMLRRCKYCSKEFKKPSDLARHLRVHTGEKPFTCEECQRKFTLKSTLESHMRTHRPIVKPFNCQICNLNFTTKNTLKVHQTIHTGVKPFKCLFCDMSFRTAGHRKSHIVVAHLANRRRQNESRKAKVRKILESVASTMLTDIETEENSFSRLEEPPPIGIRNTLQDLSSDSVEATVAAVNTISESAIPNDSVLPPNDLMISNPMVTINPSITIDTGTNSFSVDADPTSTNVSTFASDPNLTTESLSLTNAMVAVSRNSMDPPVTNAGGPVKSINQPLTNDHLINADQILPPDLTVSSVSNVLNSIEANRLGVDTLSLLQQLQPSGMAENDDGTMPLILDDVTLLNIQLAGENMQIISLSDLDPPTVQVEPTITKQESVIQKPQKERNHGCYVCFKMYASKDVLRKHIKTVHFKDGFPCNNCNLRFDQKRKLDIHMKKHNSSVGIEPHTHQFLNDTSQQPFTSKPIFSTCQYNLLSESIGHTLFEN